MVMTAHPNHGDDMQSQIIYIYTYKRCAVWGVGCARTKQDLVRTAQGNLKCQHHIQKSTPLALANGTLRTPYTMFQQ